MSLVASLLAEAAEGLEGGFVESVKSALAKIVIPGRIDGAVVEKYVRKAMRFGVWGRLRPEAWALLLALRRWGPVRSPTLRSIVEGILLEIELCTVRGRALFYGVVVSLKSLGLTLREALKNVSRLLFLGISYLNNPPMYRVYG